MVSAAVMTVAAVYGGSGGIRGECRAAAVSIDWLSGSGGSGGIRLGGRSGGGRLAFGVSGSRIKVSGEASAAQERSV
jgi:hypothetical protein